MADNVAPTIAPERHAPDVTPSLPAQPQTTPLNAEKETLFDSIAQENLGGNGESQSAPLKTFLAGLLWFGYAIAIVVALVLVWSAAGPLLKSLPH